MDTPARSPKARPEEKKKTPYTRFAEFLRKYRLPILIVFGVGLVGVLGVAAGTMIKDSMLKASTTRLEKLEADFAAYSSEQDAAKKKTLETAVLAQIEDVIQKGPKLFAAQKAYTFKARIDEEAKNWAAVEKDWLSISDNVPDSYLAPVALQGAAAAAEEQGANDRAIADYKKLIDKYSAKTVGIPHAHFALGRLAEQSKDYAGALASYQKIASSWPDSDWTKLATDRIIFIKSHGLAK